MASRKEEKATRRAEREARQAEAAAAERRARMLKLAGGAALAAVLVVAALIVISQSGGGASGGGKVDGVATVNQTLKGVRESGSTIGRANAPVEIREFADLQCPACKSFADEQFGPVVDELVRTGKARFTYVPWAILGDDSVLAGRAALAAGKQDKMLRFTELFYANQGAENSGYVDDEFLGRIADAAGLNASRFDRDREKVELDDTLQANDRQARRLRFSGTPAFEVRGPGGTTTVPGVASADALAGAVAKVSR